MKWDVMDVKSMTYPNDTFDLLIDKSTMDALVCGNSANQNVALMLKEC